MIYIKIYSLEETFNIPKSFHKITQEMNTMKRLYNLMAY